MKGAENGLGASRGDGGAERPFCLLRGEVGGTGAGLCAEPTDPLKGQKSVRFLCGREGSGAGGQTLNARVELTWRRFWARSGTSPPVQRWGPGAGQGQGQAG